MNFFTRSLSWQNGYPRNNEVQQSVIKNQRSDARVAGTAPAEPESRQAEDDEVEAHGVDVRGGCDRRVRLGDDTSDTWLPLGFKQDAWRGSRYEGGNEGREDDGAYRRREVTSVREAAVLEE